MSEGKRSAGGARTLEGHYYTSTAIFAQEIERIFMRRWLYAGRADELAEPGSRALFELGNESVVLIRGQDREIRGFYNVCRHRGARLCRAADTTQTSKTLRCPYHAWTYALDGRLLGAPHMDAVAGFERADYPLVPVATAAWAGGVFLNFDPSPRPFAEAFAPIHDKLGPWQLDRLRVAGRRETEVAANWKLIFQNYVECYHCPIIHPALEAITPSHEASNDLELGEIVGGPMRLRGGETLATGGRRCGPLLVEAEPMRSQVYYYTVFPAIFIALHPDYALIYRLDPVAVDRTVVRCEWLFDPDYEDDPASEPARAIAFWDQVNLEDQRVNERTQQGVRSRAYTPGPYSALESVSAAFDRAYLEALAQARGPASKRSEPSAGYGD